MDELVEEVLLHVPPSDPARLFRAALACKRWCRLISGPRFRRRFREFHRRPPLLGFLYHDGSSARFMPASSFRPPYVPDRRRCFVMDARHGRVLFINGGEGFIVSNPITGKEQWLPMPSSFPLQPLRLSSSAAVICAASGCDHLDCPSGGPFTVVFVGKYQSEEFTSASVYSSEAGTWSETTSVEHPKGSVLSQGSALVGTAVYFVLSGGSRILEYDVGKQELTVIRLPSVCEGRSLTLMPVEDVLGFAYVHEFKLYMWSREAGLGRWVQCRVINLKSLLPIRAHSTSPRVISIPDGAGMIFVYTHDSGVLAIDLKLGQVTEVGTGSLYLGIVLYMSFYTPALQAASTG